MATITTAKPPRSAPTASHTPGWVRWVNDHRKWLFAAPAMTFVTALIVFPLAWTGYLSLTDAEGSVRAESEFVGFQNYLDVFTDTARFWPAVGRTATFTVVALLFEVVLGMAIALLLWRPFKGQIGRAHV